MKKFALITGASGGIGKAIAKKLASEGYSLYLHYYENDQAIQELMNEIQHFKQEYLPVKADLTTLDGCKKLLSHIFSIDILIHNAGNSYNGLLTDMSMDHIDQLLSLHIKSPIFLTKQLLPKFIAKRTGNIVVVSSIWGETGASCEVVYSAAKGAQISFVKALSKEVAPNGIRVNAVAPGAVKTAMIGNYDEEDVQQIIEEIPLNRLAEPEEIANCVSFLVSESSSYITGHVLSVNGGWYI